MINLVFVNNHMIAGGIEKGLLNLFNLLDRKKYKIYLFLINYSGELMDLLPDDVEVYHLKAESLNEAFKRGGILALFRGLLYRALIRLSEYPKNDILNMRLCRFPTNVQCDILIAFTHLYAPFSWVSQQKNITKVLFIHQSWYDNSYEKLLRDNIERYKKIICVSESAKKYIDSRFPRSAPDTIVIHNLMNPENIKSQSLLPVDKQMKHFCILTVARLTGEKGCQFIPGILKKILEYGLNVYWYIVGNGRLYKDIEMMANKIGIQDNLILLGTIVNPYPFFRMCDLYVQPSLHEGYGISLQEAKILCKPIVATDIPPFREMIDSGINGTLVDLNCSKTYYDNSSEPEEHFYMGNTRHLDGHINDFADAIIDLILDQNKRGRYSEWLKQHPVDTDNDELLKLDKVISEICKLEDNNI